MHYLPLIFFSLLFVYIYVRRGIDASAYVTLLYVVSSFFGIIYYDQYALPMAQWSCTFIPTIIYCGLIALSIYPIYRFNTNNLQQIKIPSIRIINWLIYLYFGIFVLLIYAYREDILFRLLYGDFAELRSDVHEGLNKVTQYGGVLGLALLFANILATMSYIMIPVFFITRSFIRRSWWFSAMAILGSLPAVVEGILGIDRSKAFYWVVIFGFSIVVFWKHLQKKARKTVVLVAVVLLSAVAFYLSAVTVGRFEDTADGTEGGVISYAGQSYVNFCYFFENYDNGETFSTRYLFPATHFWLLGDYDGAVPRQEELTLRTRMETGVFYSFLGSFIVDNNQKGPFLFMVIYLSLFALILHNKRKYSVSFEAFLCFCFLTIIPICGFILYLYTSPYTTISIIAILTFVHVLSFRRRV